MGYTKVVIKYCISIFTDVPLLEILCACVTRIMHIIRCLLITSKLQETGNAIAEQGANVNCTTDSSGSYGDSIGHQGEQDNKHLIRYKRDDVTI